MHKFVKGRYYAEDNNGGDYISVSHIEDNKFLFEVGNCCVITIRITGTISEITEKLSDMSCEQCPNCRGYKIEYE